MKKILMTTLIASSAWGLHADDSMKSSVKNLNWNGIEVKFIEDNRFPTYEMVMYFADGALSDDKRKGETEHAFNLIDSGTSKLTQEKILDQFDFTGTEIEAETTHEYTTLSITGLSKDLNSTMKQVCHVLRDAQYPKDVVRKELDKERSAYMSMVSNLGALADRANREITMANTPYSYPVSGKLQDLDLYTSENLKNKMNYFLDKVKKRIYITGPASTTEIESILATDCKLKGSASDFERKVEIKKTVITKPHVVFVPVPEANQVQVRIGRFLNHDEINERNLDLLTSDLLGGGFTSKLMREVRVKRGLTYGINSYIASQKEYGRAGISSYSKNETFDKLIEVVENTLSKTIKEGIKEEELERGRSGLLGSHPFKFENNKAFLMQLLYLDHVGQSYDELFDFNQKIQKYSLLDVNKKLKTVFSPDKLVIFILGDKKLEKVVKKLPKKYGKIEVLDYKKFI